MEAAHNINERTQFYLRQIADKKKRIISAAQSNTTNNTVVSENNKDKNLVISVSPQKIPKILAKKKKRGKSLWELEDD